jgi:putative sterol carrier protein
MANPQTDIERRAAALWGTYVVPPLEGIHGIIEFMGPAIRCHMDIDGGQVKLSPGEVPSPDAVIASDVPEELLQVVQGKCNPITALLQGRIEVKGDLLLLTKVAGSMPELARQADQRNAPKGGVA